jgi:hypothetical protein
VITPQVILIRDPETLYVLSSSVTITTPKKIPNIKKQTKQEALVVLPNRLQELWFAGRKKAQKVNR